jgi:hypothetical protein
MTNKKEHDSEVVKEHEVVMESHSDESGAGNYREREVIRERRYDDRDLRKRDRKRSSTDVGDTISRSVTATADFYGGMAQAVARGFRAYGDEINSDNVFRVGLDNGFIEGTLTGFASYFEEMADTAYRVLEDIKPPLRTRTRDAGCADEDDEVNYDRLAHKIAAELVRAREDEIAKRVAIEIEKERKAGGQKTTERVRTTETT